MRPVLLVTGASGGIGSATARLAAARGYDLALSWRSNEAAASALVEEVASLGARAVALQADLTDPDQIVGLFTRIDAEFGRLEGLVNNAGVVDRPAKVTDFSYARLRRIFDTNAIGPILVAREAVRRMQARGQGGAIVNISSIAARLGSAGQYVDYAASKAAIDTFTKGLADEVAAQGIRVNALRPGIIDTEIHAKGGLPDRATQLAPLVPMARPGTAEEVAEAILFLLSDAARYVTGATLDVSGGR